MLKPKVLIFFLMATVAAAAFAGDDSGVENLRQTGKAFASVARAVSPSVVFIQVEGGQSGSPGSGLPAPFGNGWPFGNDLFKRFFGDQFPGVPDTPESQPRDNRQHRIIGQASGFVFAKKNGLFSDKTYLMTNNHVVENASKILVRFADGREFDAKVTGRDPQSDLAVLEIAAVDDVPALDWANSAQLQVGEWVVAIGNPFGLSNTLTVGVVSATGRTSIGINDYEDFIQTDAAINPGNSGGPLVNLDGQVVGINTAIFSRSGGYMGVGFAIPSNLASEIANQLIENGEVTRGYLGIVIQKLTPDLAKSFGIESTQGILISEVSEDSPADSAGLRQGDVIVSYRGKPVKDIGSFRNQVALTPPGSKETLTILRDGKKKDVTVKIGKLTPQTDHLAGSAQSSDEIGLTVQTLTPQLAEQFNTKPGDGVVVTEVRRGSIAAMAGIQPGTIILQVDNHVTNNVGDFKRAVAEASQQKRLLLLIRQNGVQRYVALSW